MKELSTTQNCCVPQHARSLSAMPFYKTASFSFLKPSLRGSFALSSLFHLSLSSIVLCRTASAHLHTASSLH